MTNEEKLLQDTEVTFEEVFEIWDKRKRVNRIPFRAIKWKRNGKLLDIPKCVLEEFEFTGLNNDAFPFFF